LKLGRVRVRIIGIHTEDVDTLPTNELPWAFPASPIESASMNGIGQSPIGVVEGTWIIGFTRDGDLYNDLIYFGTLGGISGTSGLGGFQDQDGRYPIPRFVGEPDTNRLARNTEAVYPEYDDEGNIVSPVYDTQGDEIEMQYDADGKIIELDKDGRPAKPTLITRKRAHTVDDIWSSLNIYDEPETPYDADYPYNHVKETESGHVIELDDTTDKERIHVFHRAGTFYEIHPTGLKVTKNVNDNFSLTIENDHVYVRGNRLVTVEGNEEVYVVGNQDVRIRMSELTATRRSGSTETLNFMWMEICQPR